MEVLLVVTVPGAPNAGRNRDAVRRQTGTPLNHARVIFAFEVLQVQREIEDGDVQLRCREETAARRSAPSGCARDIRTAGDKAANIADRRMKERRLRARAISESVLGEAFISVVGQRMVNGCFGLEGMNGG